MWIKQKNYGLDFDWNMSYSPSFDGDGGAGGGGGNGDGGKGGGEGDGAPKGEFVSKAEFDALKQQLEDQRLEMLTPEYMAFLESGKKKPDEGGKKEEEKVDFSKMNPAQIAEHFQKIADDKIEKATGKLREEFSTSSKETVAREVRDFAKTHSDYELYRPLMHGLATDPKNKDLGLQELYDKAKEHAKGYGPTPKEKDGSRRSGGEKPGGGSGMGGKKDEKLSPEQAGEAAWQELGLDDTGLPKS